MTAPTPGTPARPRLVSVAFWLLLAGAVLLIVGGLIAATVSFDVVRRAFDQSMTDAQVHSFLLIYRATGVGAILTGCGLAFLAGRARRGDARYRRAVIALALVALVILGVIAVVAGVGQPIVLFGLLPILVAVVLLTRPAVSAWYRDGEADGR